MERSRRGRTRTGTRQIDGYWDPSSWYCCECLGMRRVAGLCIGNRRRKLLQKGRGGGGRHIMSVPIYIDLRSSNLWRLEESEGDGGDGGDGDGGDGDGDDGDEDDDDSGGGGDDDDGCIPRMSIVLRRSDNAARRSQVGETTENLRSETSTVTTRLLVERTDGRDMAIRLFQVLGTDLKKLRSAKPPTSPPAGEAAGSETVAPHANNSSVDGMLSDTPLHSSSYLLLLSPSLRLRLPSPPLLPSPPIASPLRSFPPLRSHPSISPSDDAPRRS
eukprot:764798-Hanusia_phi.AAC.3